MTKEVYSIRDRRAAHQMLFTAFGEGEAVRIFKTQANNPNSMIHVYAEDYELYHLGSWDEMTGKITGLDLPEFVVSAINLKEITKHEVQNEE